MPCSSEKEILSEDKLTHSKKICLNLKSENRKIRKQVYVELQTFLMNEDLGFSNQDLRNIFTETHMYILNGLRDKSEIVREEAIKFIDFFVIEKLPVNDFYLTYLFPILTERLGSVEVVEESEEIRLQLLQVLDRIISKYANTDQLKPFLNDSVKILSETVKDRYPDIKELSCEIIVSLAKAIPRDFHLQAETLIKSVLTCFGHQRYKVRLKSIVAIGEIIMHSSYKGLDEVVGPLAEKLFDHIPVIRLAVASTAGKWLLEYRDRYSFFYKILPLLLTNINDEILDVKNEAETLWEKVGLQFQQENEQDLKEQLDYLTETPKYYPVNLKRPNLGCRVLVKRNLIKLVGAISRELMSWQVHVRISCSQLLYVLVLHAEDGIVQNLQDLLPAMYSAARDDDLRVVTNIFQASEIIGYFVNYNTWSKLILPVFEDRPHFGHLKIFAGFINGSPKEYIYEYIEELSQLLADDRICCSRKKQYQMEMVKCVKVLLEKHEKGFNASIGYNLFKIVVVLLSLKHPEIDEKIYTTVLEDIRISLKLSNTTDLWKLYVGKLLTHINVTPKIWTTISDQECIFLTVLSNSGEAFGENLDIIGDILTEVLDSETDAETRLKTYYVLTTAFERKDIILKNNKNLTVFLERLITDIFVPSLVWHPGTTAEAIRTMAVECLHYALMPSADIDLFSQSNILRILTDKLLPLLLSLLEDASYRSRQTAIECILLIKENCSKKGIWTIEDLNKVYPEILKRLDDPTEKVRQCALKHISKLFENCPEEFKGITNRAHHEYIIDTLLTHFDDNEENVQIMVYESLTVLALVNKEELICKIEKYRPQLRNQEGCDDVIKFCANI